MKNKTEKSELEELNEIQNIFNEPYKPLFKKGRLTLDFIAECKFKKPYRLFKILPDFGFIIDSQFNEGIPNVMKGSMEYTIFLDIFTFSFNFIITIENKELTKE